MFATRSPVTANTHASLVSARRLIKWRESRKTPVTGSAPNSTMASISPPPGPPGPAGGVEAADRMHGVALGEGHPGAAAPATHGGVAVAVGLAGGCCTGVGAGLGRWVGGGVASGGAVEGLGEGEGDGDGGDMIV